MSQAPIECLLDRLNVQVETFAVCEIGAGFALQCDPMDRILVHFVLRGSGQLHCGEHRYPLRPGTVLVVPRNVQKLIAGDGPIETIVDASHQCPLEDGLTRFVAHEGQPSLVIGCAGLEASIDGASDVFHHLWEPIFEDAVGIAVEPLLAIIERELADPKIGTRTIVSGLMKQILIEVFRGQLARESYRSWLWPAMMHPQLARAAVEIMRHPEGPHSVDSLACTAGMSRSRFCDQFGQAFGRSPIEFLQIVRLRMARRLLDGSALPVKSVAAAVGYSSRSHFSRAYRDYFGHAPSALRANEEQSAAKAV